ncbi:aminoglycoside adenylyltransferase domain-containing protein [Psychrobacillus sp. NPDC093200]|uniref:aminoglycoside adenylyltransferase domain-containing protein n=1 Tax=Psychrobacillus sp. NPDC093200 TaxID=3390656 RepID=UPI003D07A60C
MIWANASENIKAFIRQVIGQIQKIVDENNVGYYLHGSLAIGGFNPSRSDIDILVVTKKALSFQEKLSLTELFLKISNNPYPIEISFMNRSQLENWDYPPSYDYHFSEYWRERYEECSEKWLLGEKVDADLAAHITIVTYKGICLRGEPIKAVFPTVPTIHYTSAILQDYKDCLNDLEIDPVYSILNMLRVYRYLKESTICSKLEAGQWGANSLPEEHKTLVCQAINIYTGKISESNFQSQQLVEFKELIAREVNDLLTQNFQFGIEEAQQLKNS